MKKLTDKELSILEMNDLREKLAKAELFIEQKTAENLTMQQKLLSFKINEIVTRINKLDEKKNHYVDVKRQFVKTLTTKHKLAEGWGFDPDSGEIKED